MSGVLVRVEFTRTVFGELEDLSRRSGTSVRALVEATVIRALKRRHDAKQLEARRPVGRRLTTREVAEIGRLLSDGFSLAETAAAIGCHPNTVSNWKRKTATAA